MKDDELFRVSKSDAPLSALALSMKGRGEGAILCPLPLEEGGAEGAEGAEWSKVRGGSDRCVGKA